MSMRGLAITALLALAGTGEAKPTPKPVFHRNVAARTSDFWRDVLEPHADEVQRLVILARAAFQQIDGALNGDYDPTGEQRLKFYGELYGMLRYAHQLAPDNLDVVRLYAQAADELGKTRQAQDALEAAVRLVGPEKVGSEILGRLGAIYLRLGRLDDAIHDLRLAQGPIITGPTNAHNAVLLANALGSSGEMSEAIDVLANSLPASPQFYSNELALVGFALAVQYDRDDQRGAAFEVLDRMQNQLQAAQYAAQVQNGLAGIRWAPAEDQHYYQALLYESMGNYAEARTEWALYAAAGDLPFHARAQQHIAAIDAEPHHTPPVVVNPVAVPPRRILRP
jgi:tetratricopeptide (TPR) repeat protein